MKLNIKSLRFIMAISFIIIMLAIYSVTFVLLYNKFKETNENNMKNISMQLASQTENAINSYIYELTEICNNIVFSSYLNPNKEAEVINSIVNTRKDINSIIIFNNDGSVRAKTSGNLLKSNVKYNEQSWFLLASKTKRDVYFSEPHVQNLYEGKYPWVISLTKRINFYGAINTNSKVLLMDIPITEIENRVNRIKLGEHGYSYIADRYGNIIYHPKLQLINYNLVDEEMEFALSKPDGNYKFTINGEEAFINTRSFMQTGWRLVTVSYVSDIMVPQQELTSFVFITVIFGIITIVVVASLISGLVSKPVTTLEKSMELVEQGNFEATVDVRGDFEVERLSSTYNKMVTRIKELIAENEKEHEEKRKSEINALQMQIKPHFLYNTLESIIWMAEKNNNHAVINMTSALAKLFRISLSKGREIISVADELLHAENYLVIQKMRFEDKIDYEITSTKEAKRLCTLKLILQPIVENAIYHGIQPLNEKGLIKVDAHTTEDALIFTVKDNGVGMSEELINLILEEKHISKEKSGVGILNVHKRIKLYYGKDYGLSIKSEIDVGTTVTLTLPKVTEL